MRARQKIKLMFVYAEPYVYREEKKGEVTELYYTPCPLLRPPDLYPNRTRVLSEQGNRLNDRDHLLEET